AIQPFSAAIASVIAGAVAFMLVAPPMRRLQTAEFRLAIRPRLAARPSDYERRLYLRWRPWLAKVHRRAHVPWRYPPPCPTKPSPHRGQPGKESARAKRPQPSSSGSATRISATISTRKTQPRAESIAQRGDAPFAVELETP